jgi:surfactin synthase thioesterase subunit
MGATLSLSVAKRLEVSGDPPLKLVVSGNPGPGIKEDKGPRPKRYLMNDEDFKSALRDLGGVPDEILNNEELYDFFSPIMRADFEVLEKEEVPSENFTMDVPICALMGSEEKYNDRIQNWARFTSATFNYGVLPGTHFFITAHPEKMVNVILDRELV